MRKKVLGKEALLSFWDGRKDGAEVTTIKAAVPGNVEIDMMNAGILPDIYFGSNIKLVQQYETYNWKYEMHFLAEKCRKNERVYLHFEGVDCIADYYLNGKLIGHSENALIDFRFEITDYVNEGDNKLEVIIYSPIIFAEKLENGAYEWSYFRNYEGLRVRKAPHSYCWDIMPRLLSAGIWRPVELEYEEENEINTVFLSTMYFVKDFAKIGCHFDLKISEPDYGNMILKLNGKLNGKSEWITEHIVRFNKGNFIFDIENPKLWWPYGYGEPTMYEVEAQLIHNNEILAETNINFGVRTVELLKTDTLDEFNGEFVFIVNGERIMCKGSNWVPADALHSRDASRYEKMLSLFSDTECNIVRCWGGNVYEDHAFFDYCDKHGIMVWQDFAMACAFYPQDKEFMDIMAEEAKSVIKKLRQHPSLVLWSGDNECDVHLMSVANFKPSENKLTRQVLPDAVKMYDPFREYLPSSPFLPDSALEKGRGNRSRPPREKEWIVREPYKAVLPEDHPWGYRDYFKADYYKKLNCNFMSEMGTAGCNNLSSIRSFINEDKLWPIFNDEWFTHVSAYDGEKDIYRGGVYIMEEDIKEFFDAVPNDLESFIIASQIYHAEAFKYYIEKTRTEKWYKTGVIWWNMIDGWPQFSNALVSYDFVKKLAYYYVKRAQRKVCISIADPLGFECGVFGCNDTLENVSGHCRIWDADTEETVYDSDFSLDKNETQVIGKIKAYHGEQRMYFIEWTIGEDRFVNHYLVGTPPFSLEKYKGWLKKLAELDGMFEYNEIGK